MKHKIMDVTPELARKWLKKNKNNRNLSRHTVRIYAQDMRNGKWLLNGEPIVFDINGYLRDGQHRLHAIIEAGVTVKLLIVYEVAEENCTIFDRGRNRNCTDTLKMDERIDPYLATTKVAAAIKLLCYIDAGASKLSDFEVTELILKYEEPLIKAKQMACGKTRSFVKIDTGLFYAIFFTALMNNVSEEKLRSFAEILSSGFPKETWQTAPIVLRNDIINNKIPISGGASDRFKCLKVAQKAIYDFDHCIERKKTYKNEDELIYSCFGKEKYK